MKTAFGVAALSLFVACSSNGETPPSPSPDAGAEAGTRTTGLPSTCARGAKSTARPSTCNGAAELCDRTYDTVVNPATHNAMSNADEKWSTPNQTHGIAKQLADGVRGMLLDVHYSDPDASGNAVDRIDDLAAVDQVYLCHGPCALGRTRLLDASCAIVKFLDENPGEILTLVVETYVKDDDLDAVLRASGLAELAFTHVAGQPWPTLRSMIEGGKRLVVFLEKGGGAPAYLHPAYEGEMFDTPYSFQSQSDFSCRLGRGKAGSPLFLVNHWLGRPFADIAFAREVNTAAVLGKRVDDCTKEGGKKPFLVAVDFYEVGDLFQVVRKANGLP
ncbi:MAG: hypothetical protein JST00_00415 [Deltaproteobacteria bacterium]|nr:hypothetical protein [Deltaproteobacteria bacterium]